MTWTSWILALIITIAFIFDFNSINRFNLIKQRIKRDNSNKTETDEKLEMDENSNLIENTKTAEEKLTLNQLDFDNTLKK